MSQKALAQPMRAPAARGDAGARGATRNDWLLLGMTLLSAVMVTVAIVVVFFLTPEEKTMGAVQRVFYFHVSMAWSGFLAFFVTFVASVAYLWKRSERADELAVASSEIGLVLLSMAIISGSIWARPVWNTWWTWDARLTSTTICWLAYVAYFMLRGALDDPERAKRLSAVYALVAVVTVPITFLSIYLLRTIHPNLFGSDDAAKGTFAMAPSMLRALLTSVATFTLVYFTLLWHRLRLERLHRRVEELRAKLSTR